VSRFALIHVENPLFFFTRKERVEDSRDKQDIFVGEHIIVMYVQSIDRELFGSDRGEGRQVLDLLRPASQRNARVIRFGDTRQHGPVEGATP
jgi:hypothetical protein